MSAQDDPNLPKAGDLLAGKYRIERVLGKGGMGIVYAAHHEILAQRVAVKLLLSEIATNPEVVARFLNEARSAARIQSDNIARVMDVGTVPNTAKPDGAPMPYIVMEYLEGVDLAQLLESGGRLPLTNAVDYVLQALEALAQAHLIGIVHRDLKPANLFLVKRNDGNAQIKVLDFGISKVTNPLAGAAKTNTSSMLGTPYYMSPEQLRNAKDVDARSDIWSLGVLLHELLAGTPPFGGETLGELLMAIVEREAPSLHAIRPDVPVAFDEVLLRCLRRNRDERYASVDALADALAPFASPRGAISSERVLAAMQQQDSKKASRGGARSSSPALTDLSPAASSSPGSPGSPGSLGSPGSPGSPGSSPRLTVPMSHPSAEAPSEPALARSAGLSTTAGVSGAPPSIPGIERPRPRRFARLGAGALAVLACAVGGTIWITSMRSPTQAASARGIVAQEPAALPSPAVSPASSAQAGTAEGTSAAGPASGAVAAVPAAIVADGPASAPAGATTPKAPLNVQPHVVTPASPPRPAPASAAGTGVVGGPAPAGSVCVPKKVLTADGTSQWKLECTKK